MILERFYSMKNKSVIIEGQKVTQGTVTDFDGNFSLKVKPGAKYKKLVGICQRVFLFLLLFLHHQA